MKRIGFAAASTSEIVFGCAALVLGLAVLATLPVLQLLSLGYLLEAARRVAVAQSFSAGFVGVRKAARLGSIALGTWLLLWPLRFVALLANSAHLIEPDGTAERNWTIALRILTVLFVFHVASACWRGGRLRSFFWPRPIWFVRQLLRPGAYAHSRDSIWHFATALRLPYYFWLGLRGFVGGAAWLNVPVTLLALGSAAPVVGVVGGLLLAIAVCTYHLRK